MDKIKIGLPVRSLFDSSGWTDILQNVFDSEYEVLDINKNFLEENREFDYIIFDGGADVTPIYYGQRNISSYVYLDRDKEEFFIAKAYLHTPTNFVGVCRGHQLLNVVCNGTLYQDLSSVNKGHNSVHEVFLSEMATFLSDYIDNDSFTVNSLHHQAIDILGDNLRATLFHSNGIIEGIESIRGNKIRAVQSHPEMLDTHSFPYSVDILKYLFRIPL